jgi:hypothetical protein
VAVHLRHRYRLRCGKNLAIIARGRIIRANSGKPPGRKKAAELSGAKACIITAMNGAIDTLDFSHKLRKAGLEEKTADAVASEMAHFVAEHAANPFEHKRLEGKADDLIVRVGRLEDRVDKIAADVAEIKANQKFSWWAFGAIIGLLIAVLVKVY